MATLNEDIAIRMMRKAVANVNPNLSIGYDTAYLARTGSVRAIVFLHKFISVTCTEHENWLNSDLRLLKESDDLRAVGRALKHAADILENLKQIQTEGLYKEDGDAPPF